MKEFWRPIETAPKDGTFILLLGDSGYTTTPYRVAVGRWVQDYRDFWITHSNDAFTDDGTPPTHWLPWDVALFPTFDPVVHTMTQSEAAAHPDPDQVRVTAELDMDRIGAQHIKPCTGCDALILWAKHFKADGTIGKVAPLVKAKEGERPNIAAWYDEAKKQWLYRIVGPAQTLMPNEPAPEYVNHFMNCPKSKDFKPHKWENANKR